MTTAVAIGVRVRGIRRSPSYLGLPLAARAAWIDMSLIADERPSLRRPVDAGLSCDDIVALLGASPEDGHAALRVLVEAGILQPVEPGSFRLARY